MDTVETADRSVDVYPSLCKVGEFSKDVIEVWGFSSDLQPTLESLSLAKVEMKSLGLERVNRFVWSRQAGVSCSLTNT